jgi:hypothetical protein
MMPTTTWQFILVQEDGQDCKIVLNYKGLSNSKPEGKVEVMKNIFFGILLNFSGGFHDSYQLNQKKSICVWQDSQHTDQKVNICQRD